MMNYEQYAIQSSDSEQVKELKRQVISLMAQLDGQRAVTNKYKGGNLLQSEAIDLYPGEQLDFVISILQQAQKKCPEGSRSHDIIQSLLEKNAPVGRGNEILSELNRIIRNGPAFSEADISNLRELGFTYVQSRKHPKLKFHGQYMIVIPATPSDYRSGRNCLSEINKCIAVSQKV